MTKLNIDLYEDIVIPYKLKGKAIQFTKLELINQIDNKTLVNTKEAILIAFPDLLIIIQEKEKSINEIFNKYKIPDKKFPNSIKDWITNNWNLLNQLTAELDKFVMDVADHRDASINGRKKKRKQGELPERILNQLKWRGSTLTKISDSRGGLLYCDNPSSDHHINKIPLLIGGYSIAELESNNTNPNLATLDHIYPQKHFSNLKFDINNIQVLCKKENKRKAGDFVIDYRSLHIENFLQLANKKDKVLKDWKHALNAIHQMPIFKKTKGGLAITKMKLILDDKDNFLMVGMSTIDPHIWKTEHYPFLWDLNGKYLHKTDKKMNLHVQTTYLKKFEKGDKMKLILNNL